MKTECYWTDNTPPSPQIGLAELPQRTDVAIVGGGCFGLVAAITLEDQGADVVASDQGFIGYGGCIRNGGLFSSDVSAGMDQIEARHGVEVARRIWAWTLGSYEYVIDTVSREHID